ncbi:MAG: metallophosphoesterase [Candidatus Falkowbacteria bacterium]
MRYGFLADIHGNLLALNACIEYMQQNCGVDVLISLGDAIGYGPWPKEVVETLTGNGAIMLLGNHEAAICRANMDKLADNESAVARMIVFTKNEFSGTALRMLEKLPRRQQNGIFFSSHSCVRSLERWPYVFPYEKESELQLTQTDHQLIMLGHTHILGFHAWNLQTGKRVKRPDSPKKRLAECSISLNPDCRYLVNVGSVGQPRDRDPRASFVILDLEAPEKRTLRFCRVEYDVEATVQHMRARGLPMGFAERLRVGK